MQDSFDADRANMRAQHERELERVKEDAEREVASAKKSYSERLNQDRQEAAGEVKKLKEEMYDSKGRKLGAEFSDSEKLRQNYEEYRNEARQEADKRINKAEAAAHSKAMDASSSETDRTQKALDAQKMASLDQVTKLEEELNHYRDQSRDIDKEKAAAKADTIALTEGDQIKERNRIIDSYEKTLNRYREKDGERSEYMARELSDSAARNRTLARQEIDSNREAFKAVEADQHAKARVTEEDLQREIRNLHVGHERSTGVLVSNNEVDRNRALNEKDLAYQDRMKMNQVREKYEIAEKDAKINELEGKGDPLKISPLAIQRIQDKSDARNAAVLHQVEEENNLNLQAARGRDLTERREMKDQFDRGNMKNQRERQRMTDMQSRQFLTAYSDLNQRHQDEQAKAKAELSNSLTHQKIQNEEYNTLQSARFKDELDQQKDAFHFGRMKLADETDFEKKSHEREWTMKMTEMRRDFDNKMADERDNHEKVIGQLRYDYEKRLADQGRNSTRAMDDRVRAYEHQMKEQELAFKQREQFLNERYQEELDKMKRSNARLIQTKS